MSVSTISNFWEKSSIYFRVLVVFMFMVVIGVSNFVGASLFADDKIEISDSLVTESNPDNNVKADSVSSKTEDNSSLMLYSLEPDYVNSIISNDN